MLLEGGDSLYSSSVSTIGGDDEQDRTLAVARRCIAQASSRLQALHKEVAAADAELEQLGAEMHALDEEAVRRVTAARQRRTELLEELKLARRGVTREEDVDDREGRVSYEAEVVETLEWLCEEVAIRVDTEEEAAWEQASQETGPDSGYSSTDSTGSVHSVQSAAGDIDTTDAVSEGETTVAERDLLGFNPDADLYSSDDQTATGEEVAVAAAEAAQATQAESKPVHAKMLGCEVTLLIRVGDEQKQLPGLQGLEAEDVAVLLQQQLFDVEAPLHARAHDLTRQTLDVRYCLPFQRRSFEDHQQLGEKEKEGEGVGGAGEGHIGGWEAFWAHIVSPVFFGYSTRYSRRYRSHRPPLTLLAQQVREYEERRIEKEQQLLQLQQQQQQLDDEGAVWTGETGGTGGTGGYSQQGGPAYNREGWDNYEEAAGGGGWNASAQYETFGDEGDGPVQPEVDPLEAFLTEQPSRHQQRRFEVEQRGGADGARAGIVPLNPTELFSERNRETFQALCAKPPLREPGVRKKRHEDSDGEEEEEGGTLGAAYSSSISVAASSSREASQTTTTAAAVTSSSRLELDLNVDEFAADMKRLKLYRPNMSALTKKDVQRLKRLHKAFEEQLEEQMRRGLVDGKGLRPEQFQAMRDRDSALRLYRAAKQRLARQASKDQQREAAGHSEERLTVSSEGLRRGEEGGSDSAAPSSPLRSGTAPSIPTTHTTAAAAAPATEESEVVWAEADVATAKPRIKAGLVSVNTSSDTPLPPLRITKVDGATYEGWLDEVRTEEMLQLREQRAAAAHKKLVLQQEAALRRTAEAKKAWLIEKCVHACVIDAIYQALQYCRTKAAGAFVCYY